VENGLQITLRRSKTDQEGRGRLVAIPYRSNLETCPVRALRAWLDRSGIVDGPVFRSVRKGQPGTIGTQRLTPPSVAIIVKRHIARLAGLDPDRYGAHSLRAGFVTSCALAGMSESKIMRQSGHRSSATLQRYIRPASVWVDNAAADLPS
jgi:integrase